MNRLHYLITLVFLVTFFSCRHVTNVDAGTKSIPSTWKKIPDSWIEMVKKFKYKKDTTLLTAFAAIIKPDTIFNPHREHVNPEYGFIFTPMFVDLDGDLQDEILCLQGWDVNYPYLCLFKQVNNTWYLIYKEDAETFYSSPSIAVANNFSKNKTFYLRRVYNHGSGIYQDGFSFYKLVDNKVYKCLDIVNDAYIYGWGLFMNQSVKSTFEFSGDFKDELNVDYTYNFFPGKIDKADCSWCAHEDLPLINGEDNVTYNYDAKTHQYKLAIEPYKNSATDLTAQKIACFGDFGNDSLFVKAYSRHIDTTLKTGTPVQKRVLRRYLALAAKAKTVTTETLEVKTTAGGLSFYGPKK